MSDWWDDATPAGDPVAEAESQAVATEQPAPAPDLPPAVAKLLKFLLPAEAPLLVVDSGEPLRGVVAVGRDTKHAETIGEAAAVAGVRCETWAAEEVAAVLRGHVGAIPAIKRAFPGATVRPRPGRVPDDEIPFGSEWDAALADRAARRAEDARERQG